MIVTLLVSFTMPSRGRKFISEFLLPSLNQRRFGSRLQWLDSEKKVFQLQWNHKSASDWSAKDAAVFAAWDKRKGHYKPDDREYFSKSKQRFRAALYKFIKSKYITEIHSGDKYSKIYCIGDGKNISETYSVAKIEKESDRNKSTSQKMKHNPEDLVLDFYSISNVLPTTPQESSFIDNCNYVMKKDCIDEQVVTDFADGGTISVPLHSENEHKYNPTLNALSGNSKNFSEKETSDVSKESDVKSMDDEFHFMPETNIFKEDNLKTIENLNFHDYLCTETDTLRQVESPDLVFDGIYGDPLFSGINWCMHMIK